MQNKGILIFLTAIVSALCLYYLSFTFISRGVESEADEFATTKTGTIDPRQRQAYLDSVYTEPVFSFLGADFTYKDIKNNEVKLGLDLVGGMHVTMEVSAADIIGALAGNNQTPAFKKVLNNTRTESMTSTRPVVDIFYDAYKKDMVGTKLATIFANKGTRGRVEYTSTDTEVLNYLRTEVDNTIERSFEILRTRIDKFGVTQPNIQQLQGTNRIQIELPGVDNPERVRKLLQGVAQLEFYEVYETSDFGPYFEKLNNFLAREEKAAGLKGGTKLEASNTAADKGDSSTLAAFGKKAASDTGAKATDSTALASAAAKNDTAKSDTAKQSSSQLARLFIQMYDGLGVNVKDTGKVNRLFARPEVRALFPSNMKFLYQVKPVDMNNGGQAVAIYAIRKGRDGTAPLTGEVIVDARPDFGQTGEPEVTMQMNGTGARTWKRLTAQNTGKKIAIVLDNYVYSAPRVQNEIPNGNSSISGSFTIEEAKDLANILKAGKLPVPTRIVEESVVGPTLGKESINQGLLSILAGLASIVIFMFVYYNNSGLIANVAVLLNMFLILGILVPWHAVLTLPGIAGIVLTIGMAVDANVLINERIKDELRAGHSLSDSVTRGYKLAAASIWDANITTLLAGLVLLFFGSGPVQGFGTTLVIGIATSLFTSVYITRLIAEWQISRGVKLKVYTNATKNLFKDLNFDFVSKRKIAYMVSGAFIGIGLISMAVRGFNQGVDFSGGWRYMVQTEKMVTTEQVRMALEPFLEGYPEVKTIGSDQKMQITTKYKINDLSEGASDKVQGQVAAGMSKLGTKYEILSSAKVGPTVANDIKTKAIWSVALAMGLIFLFIWIRFNKWQYAMGATIAVVHDTLVIMTCFTLFKDLLPFSLEIDQNFIAALLTIVGFSVNDTVVIFDRVREFFRDSDVEDSPERVVNKALNDTLSRTIVTAGTVFLVVLILLVFGGETIRGLSFALLIGVITGTYSTVYIAIPFVVDAFRKKIPVEPKLMPVATV
jgi:SecD/SecF fusion protein